MFGIKKSPFKTNKMPQILTQKVDAVPSNGHLNYDNWLARESGKGCYKLIVSQYLICQVLFCLWPCL